MNGYEKRTEKKKQLILDKAQELFFEKGYTVVRIEDIAKLSNVSQVTIYNYYKSKERLLIEVLRRHAYEIIAEAEKVLDTNLTFKQKFEEISIIKQQKYSIINSEIMNILLWDNKAIQAEYLNISMTISMPFINRLFDMGKESGDIDKSISNESILSYFNGLSVIMTQTNYLTQSDEFKKSMEKLFYYGLFGK